MRTRITRLLLAGILVLLTSPVWGEYYQYTDENGVLRYTDNIAAIPPDQRPKVKIYESVKSSPVQEKSDVRATARAGASLTPASADQDIIPDAAGRWTDRLARQAEAAEGLDRIQADLNQTFMSLQNEKMALEAKATTTASGDYQKQVDALNAKIARYESQLLEFREKEKAYNAQYK